MDGSIAEEDRNGRKLLRVVVGEGVRLRVELGDGV
jgi:hypothetical protein